MNEQNLRREPPPAPAGAETPAPGRDWSRSLRDFALSGGPLIALLLLGLYLSLATPHFLTDSNLTNVLRRTAIVAILSVGQTFVILSSGIDLSVGSIAALSASTSAVLMTQRTMIGDLAIDPIGFGGGLVIALGVGLLAGLLNGLIITKGNIPDFIATLGTLATLRGLALLVTDGLPVPSHLSATEVGGKLPDQLIWIGGGAILGFPTAAVVALIVVVLAWVVLRYTALGRAIYAVGGNREAARVSGIHIDRTKIAVYMISGCLAGLAGFVLTGRLNSANALMGSGQELDSIAAVVIGGTNLFGGEGGVFGSLIGALITGVLSNGLNLLNVSSFFQQIVQGMVIVLVVIFDQWRRRRFGK